MRIPREIVMGFNLPGFNVPGLYSPHVQCCIAGPSRGLYRWNCPECGAVGPDVSDYKMADTLYKLHFCEGQ